MNQMVATVNHVPACLQGSDRVNNPQKPLCSLGRTPLPPKAGWSYRQYMTQQTSVNNMTQEGFGNLTVPGATAVETSLLSEAAFAALPVAVTLPPVVLLLCLSMLGPV